MAEFVRGDVVEVPFPFSDLSQAKRRLVLVIAELTGDDLILGQITSRLAVKESTPFRLPHSDFAEGGLNSRVIDNLIGYLQPTAISFCIGQATKPMF